MGGTSKEDCPARTPLALLHFSLQKFPQIFASIKAEPPLKGKHVYNQCHFRSGSTRCPGKHSQGVGQL